MNKKGFSLIELISVIVILGFILTLAVFSLQKFLIQGRDKSFKVITNTFEDGVLEAYTSCIANPTSSNFCIKHEVPEFNEPETITLGELEDEEFVEIIKSPWDTKEKCDRKSYVTVTRDNKDNISFSYKTCLICGEHRSEGCN